jgi:glyoxylase-like metal-dependent hydrolase (beta-lactamase superfamily II)
MRLGSLTVHVVSDGEFKLDGGAMFGVVPKVLWDRKAPADERNRIRMGTNCLLIEAGDDLVLVETGIGDKGDEKFADMFGLEPEARRLPESIRDAGFELADVTHVLLSHLHFDHCGWNTRFADGGELVPTFPQARYWLSRGEVEHGRHPNLRDRASYDPRNWEALFSAGVVELFDEGCEPVPGVRAVRASGHNADMCIVELAGGAERGVFWADLVPTTAHLPYPWVMGFDLFPVETVANKERWLPRAREDNWLCFFAHDPDIACARLQEEAPGKIVATPATLTS